ncbi:MULTISPECIES: AraC family transcriptional regulator [unclassified Burkholderia]|uniref:AraC family transcriptional regulator n=1 Tax=unclassified Burkholderia TaxID=2613784 RepID=UPI000F55F761|nr:MULTISPECIES: AraC family transcriptional regulator [unclassified Burkholderia]RQR80459.1 AraC family transcriptional regulator [Burkholderia sp. Bp9011]RQR89913.1 AraC family transcriptional regulator [Burkholderia sp. Bp9010]RQS09598.1 AraC family transcriptional regulator [Burkholderia sp. Bp8991]RQS70693.1 AraC family transcriptional regulator [Burkholderia sp. Bp8977]RQZ48647.1 AraC family transcriptional regulator [Burkholderia sp. Bp9099]
MSFWDFTRSPASARLLVDFGDERGVPRAKLLAGTGLADAQLDDPNVEVTAAQELRLTGNLLRALGRAPGLGFEVGQRYHFSAYGVWGYGLIASATARDALALAMRFLPLTYAFTVITYREEPQTGVLNFGAPELDADLSRFLVERDMAAAAVLLQEIGGGDFALSRFTMQAASAASAAAFAPAARIAGVEPAFGARANSLAFDRAFLDRPLPHANPLTVSMCEQMCSQLVETRRARLGTSEMVRQYLTATPGNVPFSLEDMARLMNTSPRTLKRRLQEEGTTFRVLLAQARGAMAETLLGDAHLSLTEVAERLGFSDLSSFSQAFKRWYGVPPGTYRSGLLRDGGSP